MKIKVEHEHKLEPGTEEWLESREAEIGERIDEMLENLVPFFNDIERKWKRTAYIGVGVGLVVGFAGGYVIGKQS